MGKRHYRVDVAKPGINGELVSPGSPVEIADALTRIIPHQIANYGRNSFSLSKELFDAEAHALRISSLYERALNENRF